MGKLGREIFDNKTENTSKEFLESIKLNLYQDEIYIFTPKGDLKILPKGATIIDFAFDIHSDIGKQTIGAKINGRMVPIHTILHSGDQVEILTSKKQKPNPDWENYAVTHKAKSFIRKWIRDSRNRKYLMGKKFGIKS